MAWGDKGIETGWMIESNINGQVWWWTGCHDIDGMNEWSTNSNDCVRFCRKEDAEMIIVGVLGYKIPSTNLYASEHQWG